MITPAFFNLCILFPKSSHKKNDILFIAIILYLESVVNNPSKKLKARDQNEIKAYLKLARYYEHFPPSDYLEVKQRQRMLLAVVNHGWATALADTEEVVLDAADIEFSESALSAKNPYYKVITFNDMAVDGAEDTTRAVAPVEVVSINNPQIQTPTINNILILHRSVPATVVVAPVKLEHS